MRMINSRIDILARGQCDSCSLVSYDDLLELLLDSFSGWFKTYSCQGIVVCNYIVRHAQQVEQEGSKDTGSILSS
jgi:hypothetical protein